MKATLKDDRGISLIVILMVMVLLLSITGAGLIFSGTGLRTTAAFRAGTQALYAADTGINVGINQLQPSQALSEVTIPTATLADGTGYRGGRRDGSNPGPRYVRTENAEGFSISSGTQTYSGGSSSQGEVFLRYQISITGTGPIGAAREVEAQARYGPVS